MWAQVVRSKQMSRVEIASLRSWDDFFPGSDRFGKPDVRDLCRWNNRVVSNLLYYQTNYLLLSVTVFILVGLSNPAGMMTSLGVLTGVFLGYEGLGKNRGVLGTFRRQNPCVCVSAALLVSYMLTALLGGAMVLTTALTLPLTLIAAHASLRLRNMKNKLENKMELTGLKRSPMGLLLEVLGQQEENLQKIQSLILEGKPDPR